MRIIAISDTHGCHEELDLPDGDLLVHSGDFCRWGTDLDEVRAFVEWFASRPHPHKVFVAGNHDLIVEKDLAAARALVPDGVTFLHDSEAVVGGLRVYGSPWTLVFFNWAFMRPRGAPLRERWDLIPSGLDLLITHGPPYGHGDLARPFGEEHRRAVGDVELLAAVRRVRPRLHVFGHIHEGYGVTRSDDVEETLFVNAASCREDDGLDPPIVVDL